MIVKIACSNWQMRAGKRDHSEGYISHCNDYTIQNILHNSKKYSFAKTQAHFCAIPNTSVQNRLQQKYREETRIYFIVPV